MKKIILLALIFGIVGGMFSTVLTSNIMQKSQNDLIKEFYEVENAVHVSPHSIRGKMDKGETNFILVDLRSKEEYDKEHIVGAVNIPAYKDKETSDYGAVNRIVNSFKELKEKNPGKDIIVYCYSTPCMTGRKVGKMLIERGVFVKHLGIGWNEWRYFWDLWNHEHEWNQTIVADYIATGSEPGKPKLTNSSGLCTEGDFGC